MNLYKFLSAEQIAQLETFSRAMEEVSKIKLSPLDLNQFSTTIDPAIYTHIF